MEVEQRCSLIGLVADDRCRPAAHSIQHTCSSQGLRAVWAENVVNVGVMRVEGQCPYAAHQASRESETRTRTRARAQSASRPI